MASLIVSPYLLSWKKRAFDLVMASVLLVISLPVMVVIGFTVLMTAGWPIIFMQKRVGKDRRVFKICKFRTMRMGAEHEQIKFQPLNEADGPVFKIRNDPRFIRVGRWLSHSGLDELPQLFNVLRGDMSMVGPRPLPVNEFSQMPTLYGWRVLIRPGIVSEWVLMGACSVSFQAWMRMDKIYYRTGLLQHDISILFNVFCQQMRFLFDIYKQS